ncbi:MAG TPA: fluoride efflux transporter CrcB [Gammaproteobacteria bacterium]
MWGNVLVVAAGGAIGAAFRYAVMLAFGRGTFPWTTLLVNVSGSLLFGFLAIWLSARWPLAAELRAFLLVGVLGAFTTFSTFSWETLGLLQEGEITRAAVNMLASVALCVLAAAAGMWLGRQFIAFQ